MQTGGGGAGGSCFLGAVQNLVVTAGGGGAGGTGESFAGQQYVASTSGGDGAVTLTLVAAPVPTPVPSLNEWALGLLALLAAGLGLRGARRRM